MGTKQKKETTDRGKAYVHQFMGKATPPRNYLKYRYFDEVGRLDTL